MLSTRWWCFLNCFFFFCGSGGAVDGGVKSWASAVMTRPSFSRTPSQKKLPPHPRPPPSILRAQLASNGSSSRVRVGAEMHCVWTRSKSRARALSLFLYCLPLLISISRNFLRLFPPRFALFLSLIRRRQAAEVDR
jgi:hypothetical protein